ncbi:unnamed protein product [Arctogadus glacialis]
MQWRRAAAVAGCRRCAGRSRATAANQAPQTGPARAHMRASDATPTGPRHGSGRGRQSTQPGSRIRRRPCDSAPP